MVCNNCGAQIPKNNEICPKCGSLVSRGGGGLNPSVQESERRVIRYTAPPVKRSHAKAIIIPIVCVIAIAGGVFAYIYIHNANVAQYKEAVALISSDPSKAKEELSSLSGYEDSSDKAKLCQDILDYQKAKALMDSGDYSGAKKILLALGNYEDSASLANDCQHALDYADAKKLYDFGDFDKAKTAFEALGAYNGSDDMALRCDYSKADADYKAGNYYSAYNKFTTLGSFSDSADRAKNCVQTCKTGELSRDPGYKSKKISVTIKTPKDDYSTYIKFYSDDNLVSTIFIEAGKKVTVKLPIGSFDMKAACGTNWFGENESFGDEGKYIDYGPVTLKRNYRYTLTLRTKGNTVGSDINRGDF